MIVAPPAYWLRLFAASLAAMLFPNEASAQISIAWSTNYYSVTGANFREIRQSISQSRPWRDGFDGDTRWNVEWKFTLTESPGQCSSSDFKTALKIVTTLPRWTNSVGVASEVKEQWTRYFSALAQHEAGHARLGIAAATEVQKTIGRIGPRADCAQLRTVINQGAERIVEDARRREQEYDRRTEHGRKPDESP